MAAANVREQETVGKRLIGLIFDRNLMVDLNRSYRTRCCKLTSWDLYPSPSCYNEGELIDCLIPLEPPPFSWQWLPSLPVPDALYPEFPPQRHN